MDNVEQPYLREQSYVTFKCDTRRHCPMISRIRTKLEVRTRTKHKPWFNFQQYFNEINKKNIIIPPIVFKRHDWVVTSREPLVSAISGYCTHYLKSLHCQLLRIFMEYGTNICILAHTVFEILSIFSKFILPQIINRTSIFSLTKPCSFYMLEQFCNLRTQGKVLLKQDFL